jgi:pimeloyl-ACP methyl ester carboxylesterase
MAGEADVLTPPEAAMFMQKRIPNSRLVKVRKSGHLPNREAPPEFDKLIDEFLSTTAKDATA